MKPVDTIPFGPEGARGDIGACVASILELPTAEAPIVFESRERFASDDPEHLEESVADVVQAQLLKWLEPRGLYAISFLWRDDWNPFGYYLLFGRAQWGPHCVVAKDRSIVHDPNPLRRILPPDDQAASFEREQAVVLVPFDPCRRTLSKEYLETVKLDQQMGRDVAQMRAMLEEKAFADAVATLAAAPSFRGLVPVDALEIERVEKLFGQPTSKWMAIIEPVIDGKPVLANYGGQTPGEACERALKWLSVHEHSSEPAPSHGEIARHEPDPDPRHVGKVTERKA